MIIKIKKKCVYHIENKMKELNINEEQHSKIIRKYVKFEDF